MIERAETDIRAQQIAEDVKAAGTRNALEAYVCAAADGLGNTGAMEISLGALHTLATQVIIDSQNSTP